MDRGGFPRISDLIANFPDKLLISNVVGTIIHNVVNRAPDLVTEALLPLTD